MILAAISLLLLQQLAGMEDDLVSVLLEDGRILQGRSWTPSPEGGGRLKTFFGTLVIPPKSTGQHEGPPVATDPGWRQVRTKWFVADSDLSDPRLSGYLDHLEAFVDWMLACYPLEPEELANATPFRARFYRSRKDYRRENTSVLDGIAARRGPDFASGVVGFYSTESGLVLWDSSVPGLDTYRVGRHELVHYLNSIAFPAPRPPWFEEGTAESYSAWSGLGVRPGEVEEQPGDFLLALSDLSAGLGYRAEEVLDLSDSNYRGRQYAWGSCLVSFLRSWRSGGSWNALLVELKEGQAQFPLTASGLAKRFHFRDQANLDRQWHEGLTEAGQRWVAASGSREQAWVTQERVARLERPSPREAQELNRLGLELLRSGRFAAAATFLRAATRGRAASFDDLRALAVAIARGEGARMDGAWPAEALTALREAVSLNPLSAVARLDHGRQLLLHAGTSQEIRAARDELGLSCVLAGAEDDLLEHSAWLLDAERFLHPDDDPEVCAKRMATEVPRLANELLRSVLFLLHDEGRWSELIPLLVELRESGTAQVAELRLLADIYASLDRMLEVEQILTECLAQDPNRPGTWVRLVECILAQGDLPRARSTRVKALLFLRTMRPRPDPLILRLKKLIPED